MSGLVLVDSGPLVALLHRADRYHAWAKTTFASMTSPLVTCEPVLTEVAHILGRGGGRSSWVLDLLVRGVIRVAFRISDEVPSLAMLLSRYATVPMSLADACLVRMSEVIRDTAVMTLDRDFRIYRRLGRQVIPVLMPPDR